MITLPIIGAVLEAAGTIIEKKVLKRKFMNFKNYTVFEFLSIVVLMLPIIYFSHYVSAEALTWKNIGIFAFVILVYVGANLSIFYSLKRENVTEFEPIWVMQPLFTILIAFFLYSDERNWTYVILALIASVTLIVAHIKREHLVYDRYMIAALLGSFLFGLELAVSKSIINYYSPFMFYFIRCFFILVICALLFRPKYRDLFREKAVAWMVFAIGIMWAVYRAIIYYGYEKLGVVFTTILFILSPVFMFAFAVVFLKEKPTKRQIISTIIILVCVALAVYFEYIGK